MMGEEAILLACPACGRRNRLMPGREGARCGACGRVLTVPRSAGRGRRLPDLVSLVRSVGWKSLLDAAAGLVTGRGQARMARLVTAVTLAYGVGLLTVWLLLTRMGEGWWLSTVML